MKKETDLESVKAVAHAFLLTDLEETDFSPVIIKHPFTDSGIISSSVGQPLILTQDEDALRNWRQAMRKKINDAESAFHIYLMITKPYCLKFLKYIESYLSREEFSKILAAAWVRTEYPYSTCLTKDMLLTMFKMAEPSALMDNGEYEQFKTLDDTLTVYRGVTVYNKKNIKALSWTLDFDVAEWFAHRFHENGTVYRANIDKSHIYALFKRGESEVIVDPKYLINITEVQSMEDSFSITQ